MNKPATEIRLVSIMVVVLFAAAGAAAPAFAAPDDHIVSQQSRTYMGNTTPPMTQEMWVGDQAVWMFSGRVTALLRFDLGKRFYLNAAQKRYYEEPLTDSVTPAPTAPERIQEVGWNYVPEYDWTLRDTGEEKVIDGRTCRRLILDGDADYAEEVREVWVSRDVPIDLGRYYRLLTERELRGQLLAIYETTPLLREGFILESRTTTENPIAPTIVWTSKVMKLEKADPPVGIYELPSDFKKVDSLRELYARPPAPAAPPSPPPATKPGQPPAPQTAPQPAPPPAPQAPAVPVLPAVPASALSPVMTIELRRLEETWRILDALADEIWPGWTGYRDVPFLFEYPNGVRMLVGHPNPTDEFAPVADVDIQGKKVYLDRSKENAIALKPPFIGGGGVYTYGKGTPIRIVGLTMREAVEMEDVMSAEGRTDKRPPKLRTASENQILINIHELFHLYQNSQGGMRYGNLHLNTDLDFAVYAEIEGLALEKSFLERDEAKAHDILLDFLAARELKRKNMTEMERNQESDNEVSEGTAVYSEAMALRLMHEGAYTSHLSAADDPFYFGFKDAAAFLEERTEALRQVRTQTQDLGQRLYRFGCFEALLLSRFFPGWQKDFLKEGRFLDKTITERLGVSPEAVEARTKELSARYPVDEITRRHKPVIEGRDAALKTVREMKGRVYVVNAKPIQEYIIPKGRGDTYKVGLINIYPRGIEKIEIREVIFTGAETLMLGDQLYYLKWVDAAGDPKVKGYTLTCSRKEGDDVYYDAEFTTKGFTLKAPKIRVKDTPSRVKVTVLAKVK
ncbi:MAG: hypothetical protein OEW05_10620 [Candidatus Aminicenantes bacterium]|nr:hypothetical protein [Candidatus Aminicenantes bacterium]